MADTRCLFLFRYLRFALLGLAAGAAACAPEPETTLADSAAPATKAFVTVSRLHGASDDDTPTVQLSARFLKTYDGSNPHASAVLVGALQEIPPAGRCGLVDNSTARAAIALRTLSPMELVHAGDVDGDVPSGHVHLNPRAYPDVARFVGGVVYTSTDAASSGRRGAFPLRLRVTGGPDVPGVDTTVEVPEPVSVQVAGMPLGEASKGVPRNRVTVTWSQTPDPVFVEITPTEGKTGSLWRCRPTSNEPVWVPPSLLTSADVKVVVHRVHQEPFQKGSFDGYLQVDASVTGRVTLLEDTKTWPDGL